MTPPAHLTRRHLLAGFAAFGVTMPTVHAAAPVAAEEFGVIGGSNADQTSALQDAVAAAVDRGATLLLPSGSITVSDLQLPANLSIEGVPGATILMAGATGRIATARSANHLTLTNIAFESRANATVSGDGLLEIIDSDSVALTRCAFRNTPETALYLAGSGVTVTDCDFADHGDAAIHAIDNTALVITANRIADCGNGGIRIWRSASGPDGSIVTQNRITKIGWRDGGNGQNGNGINVFRADEVIIADNHLSDCAFSAIRLNTTNNTQVSGNMCLRSGEVAIFSEFAFSGSIIANNIVDGAAAGISMTNLDSGGRLAVCSGNIVRNITPASVVNPDTIPYGIAAEAEAVITGNTVEKIPGVALSAGYGTFLRNVLITANVVYDSNIGIGVSVVDGAGSVHISDNLIHRPRQFAVVGLEWDKVVETDLLANADRYPNVTISAR